MGMPVSAPDAVDIASASRAIELPALTADQSSVLRAGELPLRVSGRRVGPDYFSLFGVNASLGRVLSRDDEPGLIVISDELWRGVFGGDPSIVGRRVRLDGKQEPACH